MDIDGEISKTEEKIEKLKILKAKQDELKKLQSEVAVTDDIAIETKPSKEKKTRIVKPRLSTNSRKVVACLLVFSMVLVVSFVFVPRVVAADPTIVTASPDNGTFFASTNNASGVSWNVNVSDADNDIAEVELWSNSSGSWMLFYDSGALGGVAYHDTSGQNGNWTGSWTTYWWNISVNDGSWHNTIYSFTTGYQWGDPQIAIFDDNKVYYNGLIFKNNTGEYYLWADNATDDMIVVKTSDTGANWSLESIDAGIAATGGGTAGKPTGGFTYNNQPSFTYTFYSGGVYYRYFAYYDGSSWNTVNTGINEGSSCDGGDVIYYDGQWQMTCNLYTGVSNYLVHYYGTPYTTWTQGASLDSWLGKVFLPSLAIYDGIMYCVYREPTSNLHWQTYNGASWTDRGDIETIIAQPGGGCSMVKDPVNQQLVTVYVDSSGDLRYRVTDNLTGWSKNDLIFSKGDYTIQYPYVDYIDHRLVISFSYNLRGSYDIYTISAPDYSGRISGLNYTLNRIQWPDANPDDTYVNSTIFNLRNINNRSIKTITWHFEDIGDITCASNIEVWTNMSGSWTSIGVCDASGDVSTLDISGLIPGSGEWIPGNYTYWKVEILAVGSVSEDLHSTDEDIFYKITF